MSLTRSNAWAYEGAFLFGGAFIEAFLHLLTSATLGSLLWLYSGAEVAFFYLEYFLTEGDGNEDSTMLSGLMRLVFIAMDLFWLLVAAVPLAINLIWLIPDKMRRFLIGFFLPETGKWWGSSMGYFENIPIVTNLHLFMLIVIRLSMNLVYGSFLMVIAIYEYLDGVAHGGGGGDGGGGGQGGGGGGGGRRRRQR